MQTKLKKVLKDTRILALTIRETHNNLFGNFSFIRYNLPIIKAKKRRKNTKKFRLKRTASLKLSVKKAIHFNKQIRRKVNKEIKKVTLIIPNVKQLKKRVAKKYTRRKLHLKRVFKRKLLKRTLLLKKLAKRLRGQRRKKYNLKRLSRLFYLIGKGKIKLKKKNQFKRILPDKKLRKIRAKKKSLQYKLYSKYKKRIENKLHLRKLFIKQKLKATLSCGSIGFKGNKRQSPYACEKLGVKFARLRKKKKFQKLSLIIILRSPMTRNLRSFFRGFSNLRPKVSYIMPIFKIPHGRMRGRKSRRV